MATHLTRQQLYDRIRETSKDEYILSEMVRLGFWGKAEEQPSVATELIQREGALYRELNDLVEKQRQYQNRERMLADMRKKRMEDAKKRRVETKLRNEEKRKARAEAWAKSKEVEIVYLGEKVSGGLNEKENNLAQLARFNLPVFEDALALATAMNLNLGALRFLAFNRNISKTTHYQRFYLPKKSGGKRLISAPMPRMKQAQHWILENVLYKIPSYNTAHGFVPNRSILTNAGNHLGKDVVINIDLKDFFPSVKYARVKGLFQKLGYSEQIATIFSLICTETEVDIIEMDGKKYYAQKGERFLPQGAPTSPAITNLICYKLDKRFEGLAKKIGFTYTRYADDLAFSASGEAAKNVGSILHFAKEIIEKEGFTIHPDKIHVMRKGSQQEVTGIVVNEKLGIDRETLRKFRALLHNIEKNASLKGATWGNGNIMNTLPGFASFVAMVKPEQGQKLVEQVKRVFALPTIQSELAELKAENTKPYVEGEKENVETLEVIHIQEVSKESEDEKDWWDVF